MKHINSMSFQLPHTVAGETEVELCFVFIKILKAFKSILCSTVSFEIGGEFGSNANVILMLKK